MAEVEAVRRWRWADGDMDWPDVERHGGFACAACLHHEKRRWVRGPWRIRVVRYVTTTVTPAPRDPATIVDGSTRRVVVPAIGAP